MQKKTLAVITSTLLLTLLLGGCYWDNYSYHEGEPSQHRGDHHGRDHSQGCQNTSDTCPCQQEGAMCGKTENQANPTAGSCKTGDTTCAAGVQNKSNITSTTSTTPTTTDKKTTIPAATTATTTPTKATTTPTR